MNDAAARKPLPTPGLLRKTDHRRERATVRERMQIERERDWNWETENAEEEEEEEEEEEDGSSQEDGFWGKSSPFSWFS
jgi:hypothetical protein